MTSARHPAKSPPPKIVVPKERYGLVPPVGCDPSNKSRTPPCTMSTERVRSAPMPNHQEKDLTEILAKKRPPCSKPAPVGTLDEGCRTVKQTTYSLKRPVDRLLIGTSGLFRGRSCFWKRCVFQPSMEKNRDAPVPVVHRDKSWLLDLFCRHSIQRKGKWP